MCKIGWRQDDQSGGITCPTGGGLITMEQEIRIYSTGRLMNQHTHLREDSRSILHHYYRVDLPPTHGVSWNQRQDSPTA